MEKVILIIIDGYGNSEETHGNAIKAAEPLFLTHLSNIYTHFLLSASGTDVGLLPLQNGNSEVGHLTIGAGRTVKQEILLISDNIKENKLDFALDNSGVKNLETLHFIGLVSDGGVHSHIDILKEILLSCKKRSKSIYLHFIADGRDTGPTKFKEYFYDIKNFLKKNEIGKVASVCGRFFGMDRNKNHERTEKAFFCMTGKDGCVENLNNENLVEIITKKKGDEFIEPVLLEKEGIIKNDDSIFFFNYRADRMKQIVKKFEDYKTFTLTEYDPSFNTNVVFKKDVVKKTLSELISNAGLTQTHIAETEKYAHVTYFFNGGREEPFKNEKRIFIESPRVKNYEEVPGMSMEKVCEAAIKEMCVGTDFIVLNLAGPDMIGHTGNYLATIESVKITDKVIKNIYDEAVKNKYVLMVTSDHGNAEKMKNGEDVVTKHTNNKVPFVICVDKGFKNVINESSLKDVAPTILKLMNIEKGEEMTGKSLL